jgi:hypothetical protein
MSTTTTTTNEYKLSPVTKAALEVGMTIRRLLDQHDGTRDNDLLLAYATFGSACVLADRILERELVTFDLTSSASEETRMRMHQHTARERTDVQICWAMVEGELTRRGILSDCGCA